MKSSVNLENPENLLVYMTPGVYQILCSANNTVYIGVTQNILERFGKHSATLAANKHDCRPLQDDWNHLGQDNFTFTVICCGPEWASPEDRLEKEQSVLTQKIEESYNVYNIDLSASFRRNYKRSISIDGKLYESIEAAAKSSEVGASGTVIRRRLYDDAWPTYKEVGHTYATYSVEGQIFKSYAEIIAKGLANNDGTIRRRIRSTKEEWAYWIKIS